MSMTPQEKALIDSIPGHAGWTKIGSRPSTRKVQGTDANNRSVEIEEVIPGQEVWSIVGPNGQPDEITVKAPSAPNVPYENPADPGAQPGATGYTIVQGPKNNLQQSPSQPAGSTVWIKRQLPDGTWVEDPYHFDPTKPVGKQTTRITDLPSRPTDSPSGTSTTTKSPSDPSKWQPIHENPADPTSRVIALQDPVTGDRQTVTQPAQDKNTPAGATKDTFDGGRQITWVADGNGNWSIRTIGQPLADPNKPKEGETRPNVKDGYSIQEVYRGGTWVTDPSVKPTPYDPSLANKPKENDTRQAVVDGYNVTQTFSGGQWVTTSVGTRAVPQPPTNVSAPPGQEFITQADPTTGQITNIPNANWSPADVAGQVRQIQEMARKERDRINALPISETEKHQQFEEWWQTNVEPRRQQMAQAQSEAQRKAQAEADTNARTEASTAGTYEINRQNAGRAAGKDAVENALAATRYQVGPNFGAHFSSALNTLASGGGKVNFSPDDFTFQLPDTAAIAEQATARALSSISPYAALKANVPMPQMPQQVDLNSLLNPGRYSFNGEPPATSATPATTTIAPDGTVTIQHTPTTIPQQGPPMGNLDRVLTAPSY